MKWRLVCTGFLLGALPALLAFAPAAWLADAITGATHGRLRLADAAGTVWAGDAGVALASGADARQAIALPGRLQWRAGLHAGLPAVRLQQACCANGQWVLRWQPGLKTQTLTLLQEPTAAVPALAPAPSTPANTGPADANQAAATSTSNASNPTGAAWGQWPLSALSALGAPWNTLRLNGSLQLTADKLQLVRAQGQWAVQGLLVAQLLNVSSRLSPLETLGSYSLSFSAPGGAEAAQLQLQTLNGALQLQGQGHWATQTAQPGLRFQAQASAAPGSEEALNNLLNIIGVRRGAQSVLSIG